MSSSAARAAQMHYWSLTKKRIGTRFLGLDHAGNVLLYPCYRSTWAGGWFPVTLAFETNKPHTLLMEDGYPMHHKSSKKLQQMFLQKQAEREKAKEEMLEAKIKSNLSGAQQQEPSKEKSTGASSPSDGSQTPFKGLEEDDITFAQRVLKGFSEPTFLRKYLRVNRVITQLYLMLYYGLWGCGVYLGLRLYRGFKNWLNPPARQGLCNLEEKLLYYPKCALDLIETYVVSAEVLDDLFAWMREVLQPVKDAVSESLAPFKVTWAESHQKRIRQVKESEEKEQAIAQRRASVRMWWERSLLSLLLAIIVICFL